MSRFGAPWGTSLRVISALSTVFLLGLAFLLPHAPAWVRVLFVCFLPGASLFAVCGYELTSDAILVVRPLWATRIPRAGLRSAAVHPDGLQGSIRTCGNGGLYSFTGWYWSRSLGRYRAFVTDPKRTVVLRFDRRTILISPDPPEAFIRVLGMGEDKSRTRPT